MSSPHPSDAGIGYWLKLAQQALRKRMEDELRPLGLTLSQYAVLTQLAAHPGQSNADLARRAFITAQSMQGILANLEALRLVQRTADATHGRRQPAQLTPQGVELLARAHVVAGSIEARLETAVAPLGRDEALALFARVQAAFV